MSTDPVDFSPINDSQKGDATPTPEVSPDPPPVIQGAGGDGDSLAPEAEETVWSGRTNWRHFMGSIVLGVLLLIGIWAALSAISGRWDLQGSTTTWIGFIAAVVVIGFVAGRILVRVLQLRYRITTQRLFIEKGILSQTIDQTELIRVDDVRVKKKLVDRIFGLGTIEILSTDTTDKSVTIEGIKEPEKIAEHIRVRMRTLRSRSLFVENL